MFSGSAIESIRLPSTLKRVEPGTFYHCHNLKRVEVQNGTECIGNECFRYSGVKQVTLPGTLREIGKGAFADCQSLGVVWVEEDCSVDIG